MIMSCSETIAASTSTQSRPPLGVASDLPLARFLQLLDLALDQVALERADVRDEQFSIQVIGLMLQRASQQLFAFRFEPLAFDILRAHRTLHCTRYIFAKIGQAQAALTV